MGCDRPRRMPAPRARVRASCRPAAAEWTVFVLRRSQLAARRRLAWLRRAGRRHAQDDFGLHRLIAAVELQRQAVARLEAVEDGREFAQQVDLAARRADDQVLGLQTGLIGRPTLADARQPNAAAGIVVGIRTKIDPLRRGGHGHRRLAGSANARFQPIQLALRGRGR